MATPQDSPFRLTGRGYVDQYLLPFLQNYDIRLPHVDIVIEPSNSTVTVSSREFSSEGETGRYINAKTFTYAKQDLNVMYPYPMLYNGPWPTTYRALIQWLNTTYGWVIEESDFLIQPVSQPGFTPGLDTLLSFPLGLYNGTFRFSARSTSIRFKQHSTFDLIVQPTNEKTRLESLYENTPQASITRLSTEAESNPTLPTLFTATGEACALEILRLLHGFVPARDQFTLTYFHNDNSCLVQVTARTLDDAGGPTRYSGQGQYVVLKTNLSDRLPTLFNIDGSYPLTYETFARYMRNNYGFLIEPGEFYILSDPTQKLLQPGDAVQFTPDANKQDALVAGSNSLKWAGNSRIRFNLLNV